jgi:ribosomal peptide maturation radical SAM protein 1
MTPRVALVSMPWMGLDMPSIQLATLQSAFKREGVRADSFELYVDFASSIGAGLYRRLSNDTGYLNEYIFSREYFRREGQEFPDDSARMFPSLGFDGRRDHNKLVLDALGAVTHDFLDRCVAETDWSEYAFVGLSLTIAQIGSSMAFAQRLKERNPELPIVFGGTSCAGAMGIAIAENCPYVDVVVRCEGELVVHELVDGLVGGGNLSSLPGIVWRENGELRTNPDPRATFSGQAAPSQDLNFDGYFKRLVSTGLQQEVTPWLPFEGSRGCWYGEKAQCRFCGLHEIMRYRNWDGKNLVGELERLEERYGISRFFAVDLIMPKEFYADFLPEIRQRGHSWSIFYEIKANVDEDQVDALAAGGVKWIQPGIESLDDRVLRLMRKGVSAAVNVQLLRLCAEYGIRVTWNIITGIPGEQPGWYASMSRSMRHLFHLPPPSGAGEVELHRFSPFFEQADLYGIEDLGAPAAFRAVFPFNSQDAVDAMSYRHEHRLLHHDGADGYTRELNRVVSDWRIAHERGAALFATYASDRVQITDQRDPSEPGREFVIEGALARLYVILRRAQREERVVQAGAALGLSESSLLAQLGSWAEAGVVWRSGGRVVALAVDEARSRRLRTGAAALAAPLPYLE